MAGGGVLLLCVLALVVSLADYTSSPTGVANAHVPPAVITPAPADSSQAPSPVPTIPVTTVAQATPTPAPAAQAVAQRSPVRMPSTFATFLQQLEQHRHHRPPVP
jgi:hypothetical protein